MSHFLLFLTDNFWKIVCVLILLVGIIKYVRATEKKTTQLGNTTNHDFISSKTFIGEKQGYVFKTNNGNTGYYRDK